MAKKLTPTMLKALRTLSLSDEGIDVATCAATRTMKALVRKGFVALLANRGSWFSWEITDAGRSALKTIELAAGIADAKEAVHEMEGVIKAAKIWQMMRTVPVDQPLEGTPS